MREAGQAAQGGKRPVRREAHPAAEGVVQGRAADRLPFFDRMSDAHPACDEKIPAPRAVLLAHQRSSLLNIIERRGF